MLETHNYDTLVLELNKMLKRNGMPHVVYGLRKVDNHFEIAMVEPQEEKDWKDVRDNGTAHSYIHHIDADKTDTTPRNCILLCSKCHALAHYHMAFWMPVLHALANRRKLQAAS